MNYKMKNGITPCFGLIHYQFLETTIIYFTAPIDTIYNLGSTNFLLNDYCNDRMAMKITKLNCGALHYDKQEPATIYFDQITNLDRATPLAIVSFRFIPIDRIR